MERQVWGCQEERQDLVAQKIESGVNPSRVARSLGVSRQTIYRDLSQLGILWKSEISQEDLIGNIIDIVHQSHEAVGYRDVEGYLVHRGIRVSERRVRDALVNLCQFFRFFHARLNTVDVPLFRQV